jgi:regulatory protein
MLTAPLWAGEPLPMMVCDAEWSQAEHESFVPDEPDPDALESGDDGSQRTAKRAKKRRPRKMTEKRLHNIALAYLDRYEASEASFRAMLERRVHKAARAFQEDPSDYQPMVEAEVAKAVSAGFIDNKRFAENQVYQQRGRGASARAIQARLKAKGVPDDLIDHALDHDERDDEAAAWRYAQRRRLGPFRTANRADKRDRDLAAMARAGFGYTLAAAIIDGSVDDGPL